MGILARGSRGLLVGAGYLLLLAMLAGAYATYCWHRRLAVPSVAVRHQAAEQLAHALSKELAQMATQADTMQQRLLHNPKAGFPTFMAVAHYPAYLFQDSALVFWSHFDWVPDKAALLGPAARLTNDPAGLALTYAQPFELEGRTWHVLVRHTLQRRYPMQNAYLKPGWAGDALLGVRFHSDSTLPAMARIYGPAGQPVCGIEVAEGSELLSARWETRGLAAAIAGLLLALASLGCFVAYWARQGRYGLSIGVWGAGLILVKLSLALHALRGGLDALPLFSPRLYASSALAPSLGDLLISTLLLAAFAWIVFRLIFKTAWLRVVAGQELALAAAATATYLLLLLGAYRVMRSLYLHSQTVLDVARGFRLTWERSAALGVFIAVAFSLFFLVHVLARLLTRLMRTDRRRTQLGIGIGALVVAVAMFIFGSRAWRLEAAGLAFLLAWLWLRLPEYLFRLRYQTYFYLFSIAILVAGAATQAYDRYRERKGYTDRIRFASRLVAQGDPLAEMLLAEAPIRFGSDTTLARLVGQAQLFEEAEAYVRRTFNDATFDQYALEVGIFGADGQLKAGLAEADRMTALRRFCAESMDATRNPHVFYAHLPTDDVFKRYLTVVDLPSPMADSTPATAARPMAGYLVLDLKMRRLSETSVFATLLVNGPSQDRSVAEKFSYAVYDKSGIVQQDGPFNYERGFHLAWLQTHTPVEIVKQDGWLHAIMQQADGQKVVVSAPDRFLRDDFANFSFLLLVLVAFILVFVIAATLRQQRSLKRLTFAGKIQIYLNAAFFLPLTVFGLVSFTLVEISLRADLNAGYLQRARAAAKNIEPLMGQLLDGRVRPAVFAQQLDDMARFTGLNASLYSFNGRLIHSSHPLIYRKGILSPYINPEALTQLADEGLHETLLDERLGLLNYSSAYVAVQAPQSRKISAILAVPFFEAGSELETQLSNAISTVVSSFTAVFIVFMVLSYFASQILVVPLKLITSRLQRTTLEETEPLAWTGDDEIGLLVKGYNEMLRKLEASRAALASTEKESAWREMAQQVAHEIKNPLTPMKLTVQQMQRVLGSGQLAENPARLERPLTSLLEQIETLSDIAGSFSAFARMPQPKTQRFDLARLVRRTVELHRNAEGADVTLTLPTDPDQAFVLADESIFQGIITNLVLNGLQAVPEDRRAQIDVRLERQPGGMLCLTVADNGEGIPPEVQSKVFLPNFSTKFSGSGIGLALAKRGVEHAQGRIWFKTRVGEGTTFSIELAEQA